MKQRKTRIPATFLVVSLILSVSLLTTQAAHVPSVPSSYSIPLLGGWGGSRLKDTAQNLTGPVSTVFPGEKASNFEQIASREAQLGYNAIRASFAPYCSVQYGLSLASPPDFMGNFTQGEFARAIAIAEYFNLWIIVDYHGYADFTNSSLVDCWLSFWFGPNDITGPEGLVGAFSDQYSRIIWEPLNEPDSSTFPVSATAWCARNLGQCETNKTAYATMQYQSWLNMDRNSGDTHWVVVQNLCSHGCNIDRQHWYLDYPRVNDTIQRVYESLHTYVYYPNLVEHVVYDSNNDSIVDTGDLSIVGSVANGTSLVGNSRLEFVNATDSPSETWSAGKAVVYDVDNNGVYDSVDVPVTGTVPAFRTWLRPDPLIKFVDANKNGVWDGWGNSTVDNVAQQDYLTMINETSRLGWPILNTEGGAFCGVACPNIIPGAASYSPVSLRYAQDIIGLEDGASPRIGHLLWPAASWAKILNVGEFGALNPGQWGTMIQSDPFTVVPLSHGATLIVEMTERTIPLGTKLGLGVTARNSGETPEFFDVAVRYNSTIIGQQRVYYLPVGATQTLSFTWDTSQVRPGNYAISATTAPAEAKENWTGNNVTMPVTVVDGSSSLWVGPYVLQAVLGGVIIAAVVGTIVAFRHRSRSIPLNRREDLQAKSSRVVVFFRLESRFHVFLFWNYM